MLRHLLITGLALGLLGRLGYAQDADRLIRDLGSEDPQTRERAMEGLRAAGESSRPRLEKALQETRDPEIRSRLDSLLLPYRIAPLRELVGGGPGGTVVLATVDGKSRMTVGGRHKGRLAHHFSWSPDGRFIAYAVSEDRLGVGDLYLLDLDTAVERKAAGEIVGPFRPAWSLDSRKVAYAKMRQDKDLDFCVFSVDKGTSEASTQRDYKEWAWCADGAQFVERWIGFVGSDGSGFSSGTCQGFSSLRWDPTFVELYQITGPIVSSADGRRVFFFGSLGDGFTTGCSTNWLQLPLTMLDRTTGKTVTLAQKVSGKEFEFFRNSPAVSPDGKQLAFRRCTAERE